MFPDWLVVVVPPCIIAFIVFRIVWIALDEATKVKEVVGKWVVVAYSPDSRELARETFEYKSNVHHRSGYDNWTDEDDAYWKATTRRLSWLKHGIKTVVGHQETWTAPAMIGHVTVEWGRVRKNDS